MAQQKNQEKQCKILTKHNTLLWWKKKRTYQQHQHTGGLKHCIKQIKFSNTGVGQDCFEEQT
eukprot:9855091-Ditylum_brightwellii.AAC.1